MVIYLASYAWTRCSRIRRMPSDGSTLSDLWKMCCASRFVRNPEFAECGPLWTKEDLVATLQLRHDKYMFGYTGTCNKCDKPVFGFDAAEVSRSGLPTSRVWHVDPRKPTCKAHCHRCAQEPEYHEKDEIRNQEEAVFEHYRDWKQPAVDPDDLESDEGMATIKPTTFGDVVEIRRRMRMAVVEQCILVGAKEADWALQIPEHPRRYSLIVRPPQIYVGAASNSALDSDTHEMEHLLLPRGAQVEEHERAHYIADRYYGEPFLDYPSRSRFKDLYELLAPAQHYPSWKHDFDAPKAQRLEVFLQTWVVFGLLHEVFGSLASESDFVEPGRDGCPDLLTTVKLPSIAAQWTATNAHLRDTHDGAKLLSHFRDCLLTAHTVLKTSHKRADLTTTISRSAASVAESIEHVVVETLQSGTYSLPTDWYIDLRGEMYTTLMGQKGWCSSQSKRHLKTAGGLQTAYYLSKMQQPLRKNHGNCTETVCNATQYDMSGLTAMHRCTDQSCGLIQPDPDAMKATFDNGYFGLLEISGHEDISTVAVSVVSTAVQSEYITFSHVWAEGLGNPVANALPRCQFAYVATVADELARATGHKGLPIWLDTICCPVSSTMHRNKCLGLMRHIYKNATHVLVLDAQLAHLDSRHVDSVEVCARLMSLAWAGRLWTLQEGALAQQLWIQLEDRAVSLDDVDDDLDRVYKTDLVHHQLYLTLISSLRRLRNFGWNDRSRADPGIVDVQMVLRGRSVTVPTDEPLCLCTCMNIEQNAVLQVPESERMAAFWQTIGTSGKTLPNNVLFFAGQRLEQPGVRWAPASFLGSASWASLGKPKFHDEIAVPTPDGLRVQLPAFEITSVPVLSVPGKEPWDDALKDIPDSLWARAPEMIWYMIMPMEQAMKTHEKTENNSGSLVEGNLPGGSAVILQDRELSEMNGKGNDVANGLVGTLLDHHEDVQSCRLQRPVCVLRVKESLACILEAVSRYMALLEIGPSSKSPLEPPKDGWLGKMPIDLATSLMGLAATALEEDPSLLQHLGVRPEDAATGTGVRELAEWGVLFLTGRVGQVGRTWPRQQKWCVD
ncbi:hypothetical protein LTR85_005946 [Meristemomyces frigidus]|nr:hypothetical protein LTR85_005946 [Meristemomyces frigidus]